MIRKLLNRFNCLCGLHKWTCAAAQHIPPTPAQLEPVRHGSTAGFWEYATMYCLHCGKISKLNITRENF